jgi:transcriptional regulator with XRE-family HTH domain
MFNSSVKSLRGGYLYCYSRLRDLREDLDLNQTEIANYLEIDQRVYSNYETGKREIPVHLLIKLADYYNTSTDYLLGRTQNISPYKK